MKHADAYAVALANALDAATVENMYSTLRYLAREFCTYGRIDDTNMEHVRKALDMVQRDRDANAEAYALKLGAE